MNVAIATACGRSKREGEWPACELYLSSRIRGICRRASDYGLSPHILSAEYGLVHGDQLLRAYEREMDYGRAQELVSQVAGVMSRFEWFVFFKAGARDAYSQCIRWAAASSCTPTVLLGWVYMGGFWDCLDSMANRRAKGGEAD